MKVNKRGRMRYKPWSSTEVELVLSRFHRHLVEESLPGKHECEELIRQAPVLNGRSWQNLKDFVRNHLRKV